MPTKAQRDQCGQPRPDWVPAAAGPGFATWVLQGATPSGVVRHRAAPKRRQLTVEDYLDGIQKKDTTILARAITLVESNVEAHQDLAQQLLARILPLTGRAMRVGITGIPGAGKSTFIEALGNRLCEHGHRLAVLAIDPSSSVHGGSILGDKVRMEKLSRQPGAFIRPSPSGGALGGVARKSREAMLLCEAAGYDVIFVETVGVGQNEVTVRSMVDCFLVLMIAGAGDEVQGIKKGVMELADLLAINKSEGDNRPRAMAAQAEIKRVLNYLRPATDGWDPTVTLVSALSGDGVDDLWNGVAHFFAATRASGVLENRRRSQTVAWMHAMIREGLQNAFFQQEWVKARLAEMERDVAAGRLPAAQAARSLLLEAGVYRPDSPARSSKKSE
ncbi:methylmalonyl Co-A mutase-associated GTPase MeaB [Nibricoccus sp. IMCC34717]|uniref:methylmalonyl Co-A mutase-associated GTPase MeaB n=1 Tax=Nibricoccus sp. IMCC34717 TaxID=3034021 RepID=UPI00384C81ED